MVDPDRVRVLRLPDEAPAESAPVRSTGHEEAPLAITQTAYEKVRGFREAADPPGQAMWVEITGVSGDEWAYNMYLRPLEEADPEDAVQEHEDLTILVPSASVAKLQGATVDWSGDPFSGGLKLINPNAPSPSMAERAPADLSGDVAQRVLNVLEAQVNPSIAAHGGRAELVAVEDDIAYLRLGGGCQGCGLASVTLTQGIEVAIKDSVPEIVDVVDVTDHASGANPYFEAAKK